MRSQSRRDFLNFLGRGVLAASAATGSSFVLGCGLASRKGGRTSFRPIAPSSADDVILMSGLKYQILLKDGDLLNDKKNLRFGSNCDFNAYLPLDPINPFEGLLWTNHESLAPLFVSGFRRGQSEPKTKAQVDLEQKVVGGSVSHIKRNSDGSWEFVQNSRYNRRYDATTEIPFVNG